MTLQQHSTGKIRRITLLAEAGLTAWRTPAVVIIACCVIALIGFGVRSSLGLFLDPMSVTHGWERQTYSFALAIQNLMWGLGMPIAGALTDRYGPRWVLVGGALAYGFGIWGMAVSPDKLTLQLTGGVLAGLGVAFNSFSLAVATMAKVVGPERRSLALGLGTAAGSAGQMVFSPIGLGFMSVFGWQTALVLLASFLSLIAILAFILPTDPTAMGEEDFGQTISGALREAVAHRGYALLTLGFFVSGFHLAFITVHFPAFVRDLGLPSHVGAYALSLIGIFSILGSFLAGLAGQRWSKKLGLSLVYFLRSVAIIAFLLAAKTELTIGIFSVVIGFFWLATVPLTTGVVAQIFGARYMTMLFGIVLLSHQMGSFVGVWIGGYLFDATGSYDGVWWLCATLGFAAALIHLPIDERPLPRLGGSRAPAEPGRIVPVPEKGGSEHPHDTPVHPSPPSPAYTYNSIRALLQLRRQTIISRGTFLLQLERLSQQHDAVSERLRPDGDWGRRSSSPRSVADWIAIEDYLGFFEHCEILIRNGSLNSRDFRTLFGYRLRNALANPVIVMKKLHAERENWQLLWSLLHRVGLARKAEKMIKTLENVDRQELQALGVDSAGAVASRHFRPVEQFDIVTLLKGDEMEPLNLQKAERKVAAIVFSHQLSSYRFQPHHVESGDEGLDCLIRLGSDYFRRDAEADPAFAALVEPWERLVAAVEELRKHYPLMVDTQRKSCEQSIRTALQRTYTQAPPLVELLTHASTQMDRPLAAAILEILPGLQGLGGLKQTAVIEENLLLALTSSSFASFALPYLRDILLQERPTSGRFAMASAIANNILGERFLDWYVDLRAAHPADDVTRLGLARAKWRDILVAMDATEDPDEQAGAGDIHQSAQATNGSVDANHEANDTAG